MYVVIVTICPHLSKAELNEELGGGYDLYADYDEALAKSNPDAVCISTYPDTHEEFSIKAFEAGCHVFDVCIDPARTDFVLLYEV